MCSVGQGGGAAVEVGCYMLIINGNLVVQTELSISLSSRQHFGPVEITRDHERGGICSLDTTDVEASVICKSMGYRGGKVSSYCLPDGLDSPDSFS